MRCMSTLHLFNIYKRKLTIKTPKALVCLYAPGYHISIMHYSLSPSFFSSNLCVRYCCAVLLTFDCVGLLILGCAVGRFRIGDCLGYSILTHSFCSAFHSCLLCVSLHLSIMQSVSLSCKMEGEKDIPFMHRLSQSIVCVLCRQNTVE